MSRLEEQLKLDQASVKQELARIKQRRRVLRHQLQYINTLLRSATAPQVGPAAPAKPSPPSTSPKPFVGMTIADIAAKILAEHKDPLSAMEIAKRAMTGGFAAENIERARSHFSATISKDINSAKPRFWQADRGAIGLAEWRPNPPSEAMDGPPSFGEEQQFRDDDIPF